MSSTPWPGSAARDSRTGTTTSPTIVEVVLEQQVVVLADGAVDDVLDRHDASRIGRPGREGLEYGAEAADGSSVDVTECREHRVLGERAGLAGVDDSAAGWLAFHGWRVYGSRVPNVPVPAAESRSTALLDQRRDLVERHRAPPCAQRS